MRTVYVIIVGALLIAATPVWAFEPNWGETIPVATSSEEILFQRFAWSPDGSKIAFVSATDENQGEDGVWLVDADGGDATLVYRNDECYENVYKDICFTPDGAELTISYKSLENIEARTNDITIANINLTTGAYREITLGSLPVWSPSGRYLCIKRDGARSDDPRTSSVIIYDTATESETLLMETPSDEIYYGCHSFLPDESGVVVSFRSREADGIFTLYRISITGGEPEEIIVTDDHGEPVNCKSPVVHPDGIHVIVEWELTLMWVDMHAGTVKPLTPSSEIENASWAALSPDGKKVCFAYFDDTMMENDSRILWFELHILDLADYAFDGFQTAVESETPAAFPTLASYPNPFNPSTTISFNLPEEAGFTELAVYNLAGQKIRTLVAGELTSGVHEVVWDGRDDSGNPVSSGIFVTRLVAGDTVVTNRMMLVK